MSAVSQRYATEYPGEFIFTQESLASNNISIANTYEESAVDVRVSKSLIDSMHSPSVIIDDVEKLKDEIQILKDEIENLKMLLLEN
jgi:hypothetical protein